LTARARSPSPVSRSMPVTSRRTGTPTSCAGWRRRWRSPTATTSRSTRPPLFTSACRLRSRTSRRTSGNVDTVLPDYASYDQAAGLDWYAVDPNLRATLDRLLPDPTDRAFAEAHVSTFGTLVGGTLAARAEITDKHGPVLRRYDEWGHEVAEVVHHPTWTDNKADLVRHG